MNDSLDDLVAFPMHRTADAGITEEERYRTFALVSARARYRVGAADLQVSGDGEGVLVDGGGPPAVPPLGGCGGQTVHGALVDELAFHLRGHRRDYEQASGLM